MSILKTEHLIKQYGKEPNIVRALDDVSISVEPGEFVAIIGQSGSGKSTLIKLLLKELEPSSGMISSCKLPNMNIRNPARVFCKITKCSNH